MTANATVSSSVDSGVDPAVLTYDDRGLVPVVAQDIATGSVLMVAWADREAVTRTLSSGEAWFWSRSREQLWHKGATSGNTLKVAAVRADCDGDTLLYRVHPSGPACHTGARTCFEPSEEQIELGWLWSVLESRRAALENSSRAASGGSASAQASSYTARLLASGRPRIAQKVAEEGAEVAIAAVARQADGTPQEGAGDVVDEAADLLYHLLVLLLDAGLSPRDVARRLAERHTASGVAS